MNSAVDALAYDSSGVLYAGGYFTSTGAVPANRIALWDGADWRALGTGTDNGVNGSVHALGVDGRGGLYAGGEFTMAGDIPVNYVARWDGSAWNALGSGMAAEHASPQVRALVVDSQGDLYAGGDFTSAGSVAVNYIARWDGESWSALGSGIGAEGDYSYLSTLVVDAKGNLFAGGQFTLAGKKPSAYLAKWCAELDAGICNFAVAAGETTQAPTPVVIAQTTATAESLTVSPTASGPTPFPTQTAVPAAAVQDDGGDNSRFVIGAAAALAFLLSGFLWFRFRRQKGGGRS